MGKQEVEYQSIAEERSTLFDLGRARLAPGKVVVDVEVVDELWRLSHFFRVLQLIQRYERLRG